MQINKRYLPDSILPDYVIPMIIVVAIAIVLFVKATTMAHPNSGTRETFYSLTDGFENYYEFKTAWRPRLFSTGLAAWTVSVSYRLFEKIPILSAETPLELAIGLWTAGWFISLSFILVMLFKRRSLFYIFGIFAGISFGYMEIARRNLALRLYPWDMPSLFFFTIFMLLFVQKRYYWLLAIIPLSVGFKESTMILCFGFLMAELPWKKRWYLFLGACLLCLGLKIILDLIVHGPLIFTMETKADQIYREYNWYSFRHITPFFVNAGTLLSFLILPNSGNKNIVALKIISIPFIVGTMLFGMITEYRIWFELIPFALYALDVSIYGDPLNKQMEII